MADEIDAASVNGDLFWTARDIVRNLGVLAVAQKMDEWSSREIHNQNDLFVQPMLVRARTGASKPSAVWPRPTATGCSPGRAA